MIANPMTDDEVTELRDRIIEECAREAALWLDKWLAGETNEMELPETIRALKDKT